MFWPTIGEPRPDWSRRPENPDFVSDSLAPGSG